MNIEQRIGRTLQVAGMAILVADLVALFSVHEFFPNQHFTREFLSQHDLFNSQSDFWTAGHWGMGETLSLVVLSPILGLAMVAGGGIVHDNGGFKELRKAEGSKPK